MGGVAGRADWECVELLCMTTVSAVPPFVVLLPSMTNRACVGIRHGHWQMTIGLWPACEWSGVAAVILTFVDWLQLTVLSDCECALQFRIQQCCATGCDAPLGCDACPSETATPELSPALASWCMSRACKQHTDGWDLAQ